MACGAGLVGVLGILFEIGDKITVLIPGLVEQLDEPNAAFDEAPGE